MNEKNACFKAEADNAASERSSEVDFVNIFLEEASCLKKIVAGMGFRASDAEDILQDVAIQALRRAGKYQTKEDSVRWLIKVAVNRCLTEFRRRRRFHRKASEILKRRPESATNPTTSEKNLIVAEELEIVRECLKGLDETLLLPMVLCYFCELNSKEVGEVLALSPSTVRNRLRKARMILAKRLLERGVEP